MLKLIIIAVIIFIIWKIFASTLRTVIKIILFIAGIAFLLSLASCDSQSVKEVTNQEIEKIENKVSDSVKIDSTIKNAGKTVGKATKSIVKGFNTFKDGFTEEIKK